MKRAVSLLAVLLFLSAPAIFAQSVTLGAVLTGAQEAPTPRDTPGFGTATVTLDASHTLLTVNMTISGLTTPVNNSHIHVGAAGTAGAVVLDLVPGTNLSNGRLNATYTIPKVDLGDKIFANPQNYYLNVHTTQFGGGEVRGQLTPINDTAVFGGELRGVNEVPPTGSTALGSFFLTLDNGNNLAYHLDLGSLQNPTLAHIHLGIAGGIGSPVVNLATSAAAFSNGRLSGTAAVPADVAGAIRNNPAIYYVNVHTTQFGGGEIRGQLAVANEYDLPLSGRVTGGSGVTFVTDARVFNPSYKTAIVALLEFFPTSAGANANASASTTVAIPARGTAALDDVAGAAGFNVSSTGALRVSSTSRLVVTSSIFADLRSSSRGTLGQFVAATPRGKGLRHGVVIPISNRLDGTAAGYRTNVGWFNPTNATVFVRLELRDISGALIATATPILPPLQQRQNAISDFFPGIDLRNREALSLSFHASAPILFYGSLVDNVSNDPIFVPAQEETPPGNGGEGDWDY